MLNRRPALDSLWAAAQARGAAECRGHDTFRHVRIEWSGVPEGVDPAFAREETYTCAWLLGRLGSSVGQGRQRQNWLAVESLPGSSTRSVAGHYAMARFANGLAFGHDDDERVAA